MSKIITATFKTKDAAFAALTQLETIGVTDEQVGMIVSDETRGKSFNIDTNTKADKGAAAGATFGGIVGAVVAAVAGAGAIAIPGLNLVVAGTLISGLAGLGAGAATGGLVGALVGAGIPEHEAKLYEDEIKNGSILIAVDVKDSDKKDKIEDILKRTDAHNLAA